LITVENYKNDINFVNCVNADNCVNMMYINEISCL